MMMGKKGDFIPYTCKQSKFGKTGYRLQVSVESFDGVFKGNHFFLFFFRICTIVSHVRLKFLYFRLNKRKSPQDMFLNVSNVSKKVLATLTLKLRIFSVI